MRAASLIAILLALAAPASAATGAVELRGADVSSYPNVSASVVTPAPSARAPFLRENGERVIGFKAENLARAKNVLLAIDISRSMDGQPFADAVAAARQFVAAKPAEDRVSLVVFGSRAQRLTQFSSSTIDADAALAALAVDSRQGTALYDAVAMGARALGAEDLPGRVLIVLTDGDDTTRSTLAKASAAAKRAGATVYAIGIEGDNFSPRPLQELASSTGGEYFPVGSSGAVTQAYEAIAEQLRRTWRVSYVSAAPPGDDARLDAAVAGMGTATLRVRMPGESVEVSTPSASPLVPGFLYEQNRGAFLLALFSGACAILGFGLLLATPGGVRLRRQLEPHTTVTRAARRKKTPRERFAAASGMLSATEKAFAHLSFWNRMHRMLERADLPLRTVEFFYICVGTGVLFGLVSAVAAVPPLVSALVMAGGAFLPILYVGFKARKRITAIEDQMPDILITIAASLKAGHSFRQGLQAVVDEGQPPASDEFKRVLTETSLGRPMDEALAEMAERIGSKNLDFVITAVTIQRQVGGSLAAIFDMVADTVRQRQQFIRKIKGLTAMGRMSAYVLVAIPFFLAAAFTLINPDYMSPLWSTSAGHKIVMAGLVMMCLGAALLRKIVSFKG